MIDIRLNGTQITQRRAGRMAAAAQQAQGEPMPDAKPDTERVTFDDGTGTSLVGILTLLEAQDVAVLCHGYTSSKDGMHLAAIAERLAASGMASLRQGQCTVSIENCM